MTEQETDVTAVEIIAESGVRTIERNLETTVDRTMITERNTTHERVAVWPPDQASQRAWALSVVTQNRPNYKDDIDFSLIFKEAERVANWVNGGRADD